jgi:PrcB C-terminal
MKSASLILTIALIAGCATAAPKSTMSFRMLQQGAFASSSNDRPSVLVARDAETYRRLWNVVIESGTAPQADFAKESVIFLIDQQRFTGGHAIAAEEVTIDGGTAVVKVAATHPQRGTAVTQVLTVPFAVIAVPKAKIAGARWVDAADGSFVAEDVKKPEAAKKK